MNPKSFLAGILEAGVIALTFRTEDVGALEGSAGSVDGKAVIIRDGDVFGAAAVLLPIVPILVITRTFTGFGLPEGAAKLLAGTASIRSFAVLVHGESGGAKKIACRQLGRVFGIPLVDRNNSITLINVVDSVVDGFDIIALVSDEGAFVDGDDFVGGFEDIKGNRGVGDIGGRGDLIDRQTGDAVNEDVILVTPIELILLLIVLVGSSVNAQGAVGIVAGLILRIELRFHEGLGIVLGGAGRDRRGIQSDEGGVENPHLVKLPDLYSHDLLQFAVLQPAQKPGERPVGRQWLCDVKAAVVGNQQIALKEVQKVSNLLEALALHYDERAEHGFLRETLAPRNGTRQFKVNAAEELVVKRGDTLGCEQHHIPHDFLSVDRGQPLSVWFLDNSIIPHRLATFYIYLE